MPALLLTPETRKDIDSLVEHASRPENRYKPSVSRWVPGDRKEFVRVIPVDYRLVFTLTELPNGEVYRHMSLSVPRKGKWPNEIVTFTLATMCGFTGGKMQNDMTVGPGSDWRVEIDRQPTRVSTGCIVIAQKITPSETGDSPPTSS